MKSAKFRLLVILVISTVVTTTMANYGFHMQDNSDKHDAEHRLWKDLSLKNYNFTSIPPPHNKSSPITVQIGLDLVLISGLDARTQTLTTEMWLSMNWKDRRLSWDPTKYENITTVRVPNYMVWRPDVKLLNSAKMASINNRGYVPAMLFDDGEIVWIPPSTFYSVCPIDLKYYPYDEHTCEMKFVSWTMDGDDLDLQLSPHAKLSLDYSYNDGGEWQAVSSDAVYSQTFYECCAEPYPDVTFSLVLRRRSPLYKLAILCPVLSAVGIALATFCLSPISQIRMTLNAVALLTLVLELTHLSSKLPPVGTSSPIIFSFCGTAVVLVALSTVMSASIQSFLRSRVNVRPVPEFIKIFTAWRPVQMIQTLGTRDESSTAFVSFKENQEEERLDATDAENPFNGDATTSSKGNFEEWIGFFQIVDRIAFAVFLFISIVVLIVVSV